MRPYQIIATERIINRIEIAHNYKKYGDISGVGYIWHTTGSRKTLTSFKTARIASRLLYIGELLQPMPMACKRQRQELPNATP